MIRMKFDLKKDIADIDVNVCYIFFILMLFRFVSAFKMFSGMCITTRILAI